MENAAKALLIAAGVFFAILILSLLVMLYNQISSYYAFQHNMAEIEQTQEFNAKFDNYHGKEIRGNELISIMNRIIDYNNLQADMKGYEKIKIKIALNERYQELSYDKNPLIIVDQEITNYNNDDVIKNIANVSLEYTTNAQIDGITERKLQKLSGRIQDIVLSNPDEEDKSWRAQVLTRILGYTITPNQDVDKIVEATKKYYELTQFKRVVFKCTEVSYNTGTGRVNGMQFKALENDDRSLKMD